MMKYLLVILVIGSALVGCSGGSKDEGYVPPSTQQGKAGFGGNTANVGPTSAPAPSAQ